jgi:hypothetical protein
MARDGQSAKHLANSHDKGSAPCTVKLDRQQLYCEQNPTAEAAMAAQTSWFYPIGSLLAPSWAERAKGGIYIPFRRIKALVNSWLEQGSPWNPGKFAQDPKSPPKEHPLEEQGTSPGADAEREEQYDS